MYRDGTREENYAAGNSRQGAAEWQLEVSMSSTAASASAPSQAWHNIADHLRSRCGEICQDLYVELRRSVPDPANDADPEYQEEVRLVLAAVLEYVLDSIAAGAHWPRAIPPAAAERARRAARADVSLSLLVRRYIAAHARLGEHIADAAAKCRLSSDDLTMQRLRHTQDQLLDHLTAAVEHEYMSERQRVWRRPADQREIIVHRLLHREPAEQTELAALGYSFDSRWHIGVVVAGSQPEQTLTAIGAGLRSELLTVSAREGTIWAWLGTELRFSTAAIEDHLPPRSGVRLAIGTPRFGLDGWRRTHREALAVWPVSLHSEPGVIHCADATLDAALLSNEVLATVHHETFLRPLDSLRDGGQTARDTLEAYFACEGNIASTSARLKVTRRTVENRLSAVAESLHRPLRTCLPEIEVALRVESSLRPTQLTWLREAFADSRDV